MSAMLTLRFATSVNAVAMTAASKIRTAMATTNPDDLLLGFKSLVHTGSAAGGPWTAFPAGSRIDVSPSRGMPTVSFVLAIVLSYLKTTSKESKLGRPSQMAIVGGSNGY